MKLFMLIWLALNPVHHHRHKSFTDIPPKFNDRLDTPKPANTEIDFTLI
jgi:hypothetical protein